MNISITKFKGMAPKIEPRLLSSEYSQESTNIRYDSGSIVPLNDFIDIETVSSLDTVSSVFKYKLTATTNKWLYFNSDVSLARDPIYSNADNRVIITGLDAPRVFDSTIVASNSVITADNTYLLGLPVPTEPVMAVYSTGTGYFESRSYTIQYDRLWTDTKLDQGAYSNPAETSDNYTYIDMTTNGVATISGIPDAPAGYGITHITVNRSGTTLQDSFFHFVDTFSIASAKLGLVAAVTWDAVNKTFTYTDSITTESLGQVAINQDYEAPETTMGGVIAISNGLLAGFYDNYVCFCEPFQSHAWPAQFRVAIDRPIVGLGYFGDIVVVCTEAEPYIIQVSDPASAVAFPIKEFAPCLSASGIVSYRDAVVYPSTAGIMRVDRTGVANLTQNLADIRDMKVFNLTDVKAAGLGIYYYVLYTTDSGQRRLLMFNMQDPDMGFSLCDSNIVCMYSDFESALLYAVHVSNLGEQRLGMMDSIDSDIALAFNWKSKIFLMPDNSINLSAARIHFNASNFNESTTYLTDDELSFAINSKAFNVGPINGYGPSNAASNYLTFTLWADGEVVFTKKVYSTKPFRLPSGYVGKDIEISLSGSVPVYKIDLATSMQELTGEQ